MENKIADTIVLDELFSPLPLSKGFGNLSIKDTENEDEVELNMGMRKKWNGENYIISSDKNWSVTKGAIAKSFLNEMNRIIDIAKIISSNVIIYSSHSNMPVLKNVKIIDQIFHSEEDNDLFFSRKTNRLLRDAVEYSGKDPNPCGSMIFNRKYWHEKLRFLLKYLLGQLSIQLVWVEPNFIPVFSVALKELKAVDRFPGYVRVLKFKVTSNEKIPENLLKISEFLNNKKSKNGLEYYKAASSFLENLNINSHDGNLPEINTIFFKETPENPFYCICIGFVLQKPKKGYPIHLTNGEKAYLPSPPWLMGQSF